MRSRVIVKCREWVVYYYEKIMEWLHSIKYHIIPRKRKKNSLVEEYHIYEHYAGEPFTRDFLEERTRKAITNRYGIKINTTCQDKENGSDMDNTTAIGKVRLMRNRTLIDEATLVIKNGEKNLIYWKFNK
jgi:hypothetical protein